MGGVSKNMTASPKTKVRPLPFSRVGDPAKRVIRNPPTLRRPSSFSPLRNLARSRVTNNAECRRRRARARARPGAERARDQGSSRVPRSAPSVSPSPRRATTRASPSSLFPPASDALPPASGKATTNLGTGDARARGDVRAPRRASARARGFWVPEPTRAKHPRGRGRVDRPGAARPRPVGARAQVAAKYPRGGRPSWNPGAPELEPGPRPRRAAESFAAARAGGGDEPGAPSGSGETVRFRRANARARGRTVRSRVAVVQPLRPHQRQPRVPARHLFLRAASAPSPSRLFRKTAPRRPRRRRGRVPGDAPAAQRGAPARVRGRALAGRRRGERGSGERGSGDGSRRTGTGTGTGTRVVRSRVPSPGLLRRARGFPLGLPRRRRRPRFGNNRRGNHHHHGNHHHRGDRHNLPERRRRFGRAFSAAFEARAGGRRRRGIHVFERVPRTRAEPSRRGDAPRAHGRRVPPSASDDAPATV